MSDEKKNWIVTVECVVKKKLYLEDCTQEQATKEPWDYAVDEEEYEQTDWTFIGCEPNE